MPLRYLLDADTCIGEEKGTGYIYGPKDRKCTLCPFLLSPTSIDGFSGGGIF
jgi:hypothetical protein